MFIDFFYVELSLPPWNEAHWIVMNFFWNFLKFGWSIFCWKFLRLHSSRDTGPFFSLVLSLFGFDISIMLVLWKNLVVFLSFLFNELVWEALVFFFGSLVEFTSESIWDWAFFGLENIFITKSISLFIIDLPKYLPHLSLTLVDCMHLEIYPFLLDFPM